VTFERSQKIEVASIKQLRQLSGRKKKYKYSTSQQSTQEKIGKEQSVPTKKKYTI